MDVTVIIVNYNSLRTTAACIERVIAATKAIDFEIIVVDNASTDGSREHFSADRRITYIYNHENIGFGRANNLGLEQARGRNIIFLNPDTLLINDAISILCRYLDQHSNATVVGGNLFDREMQPALSFRLHRPSILWEISQLMWHIPDRLLFPRRWFFNKVGRPIQVGYITGADLMARRAELMAEQGFAREFFMYYEDTDLCHRLKFRGNIISVADAHIQHLEGGCFESEAINTRRIIFSEQGRHIYYRRNHSLRYHIAANYIYMGTLRLHGWLYKAMRREMRYNDCRLRLQIVKDLQRSI